MNFVKTEEDTVLQMTRREEFLINLTAYLIAKKYSQVEIEQMLNNKNEFLSIDIMSDELDYFDLSEEDFIWKQRY